MPSVEAGLQIAGKPTSVSQPGTAQGKLRYWTANGVGVQGAIQHQVNLIFRTEPEGKTPLKHIVDLQDVTKGLGLDETDREKVERILTEVRVDLESIGSPRIVFGREQLSEFLQKTKRIPSDVRMEIRRRAMEWWRKNGHTTYEGKPMIRHMVSKSYRFGMRKSMIGNKAEPPKPEAKGEKGESKGGGGGAPYIGPRGGKWADPQHTIPYTDIDKYKMRVSGKDHAGVAKKLEAGIKQSADICKITPPICHGNLGIERKDMPQLPDDVIPSFLKKFQDRGVSVKKGTMAVGQLKATQKEINAEKVMGMVNAYREGSYDPSKKPIIVSKDGYVLDGHHRWASMLHDDPGNKMRVYQVDTDIKTLLKEANNHEGVSQADFSAPSDMKNASSGDAEDSKDAAEASVKKAMRMHAIAAANRDAYMRSLHG